MADLYLIRHAQSQIDKKTKPYQWALSDLGRLQASRLADALLPLGINVLVSSPYDRCRDTLDEVAKHLGLIVQIEQGLRERNVVDCYIENFENEYWRGWDDVEYRIGDCETSRECLSRMQSTITAIAQANIGKVVGICGHGNAFSLLLRTLKPTFSRADSQNMKNPDVYHLTFDGELRWIETFNLHGPESFATLASETPIAPNS